MKIEPFEVPPEPAVPRARPVRLLWYEDWWDGPLAGMSEWEGRRDWFHFFKEDDPPDPQRWFWIFRLTPEQQVAIEHRHRRYQELVGNGSEFVDDPGVIGGRRLQRPSTFDRAGWDDWRRECGDGLKIDDLTEQQIVAWFKEEDTKGTAAISVHHPKKD